MKFNLIAGFLWLTFGLVLMVLQKNHPDNPAYYLGVGISAGWLGLVFALYNFSKVYAYRTAARTQQLLKHDRERHSHVGHPAGSPDPAFELPQIATPVPESPPRNP